MRELVKFLAIRSLKESKFEDPTKAGDETSGPNGNVGKRKGKRELQKIIKK